MSRIVRYLRLDGKTWTRLRRKDCLDKVYIYRSEELDEKPPGPFTPGLVLHWLCLTPDHHWVEHTWVYDPFADPQDVERYCEVTKQYAIGKLAEVGASIPPEGEDQDLPPIICSQNKLGRFLGYEKGYTGLLEHLKSLGSVREYVSVSPYKFKVWLSDPKEHQEALNALKRRKT
jgi:hypothetical protein